ncbi:MAG: DUF2589 domain-containing protein [Prevotella sp.]|uniref:DUF2589 domain-containing protein n=1 Tax=Leyella stercorea TaxID=363265 RepID=UPI0025F03224|nr:DUF2589 domain-containing protein [Prevotella sp.]MCI7154791.1 DUF2589 domain-containing protein [Prevotella sp.]MDD7643849.1 DUF2589 domain-containing protein [Leyella stercorea]MDY4088753.1 DUF2589 domain-containing protein [Prevotella sp.]MDY5368780.1 DUF2589 domain-containing protein [Prevotella sp.]
MADGPNTNSGSKVASALNSIPFGNIIGGPLAACVRAQAEAAQTTIDFIRGFTMTNSELDPEGVEPITVTFTFIMNGEKTRMTVPLMTIVPIPYMHIDYIDLNFTADITACDDGKIEAKYATEGYTRTEDDEQSVSVESKMGINVRASTSSMPSGMAKMLEFFTNNLIVHDTLTPQQVEDMKRETERKRLEHIKKKERMVGALVNALAEYKKQESEREEQRRNEELKKQEELRKQEEERKKKEEQERLEKLRKEEEARKKKEEEEQKKRDWDKFIEQRKKANLASRISKVHVDPQKPFALPPTNSGKAHPCCTFDPTQSIKWNIDRQERLRKACKKKDWLRNHLIRALYTAYYIYPYDINSKEGKRILKRELEAFEKRPNGWYTYGEPYNNTITNGYRRNGAIDTAYTEFVSYILENERKRNK